MDFAVPSFPLRTSGAIPAVGLGTVSLTAEAIASGLRAGYRLIDTALLYNNHDAVREGIKISGVPREDIFIMSKVAFFPEHAPESMWMYNPNNVKGNELQSIEQCLEELDVEHLDLLLVHNPCVSEVEYNASCFPHFFELRGTEGVTPAVLSNGHNIRELVTEAEYKRCVDGIDKAKSKESRKATWLKLEQAQREGKCRHIGVSNYSAELLLEMKSYATVLPVVNELELHPRFSSPKTRQVAKDMSIVLIGYGTSKSLSIRTDDVISTIAARLSCSPIKVVLRWMYQHEIVSIPRSSNFGRQQENLNVFDIELSAEDMSAIDGLNEDYPYYWDPRPNILATDVVVP